MQEVISITPVDVKAAASLAVILSNDSRLAQSLGVSKKVAAKTLLNDTSHWQSNTNSESFAITLNERAIGLISLSHQSGSEARVGYWLASSYWNMGYTTRAFNMIVAYAKANGFSVLRSTLDPANAASVAIWRNRGADFKQRGEKLETTLEIV